MAASYSARDLSLVPNLKFAFVEEYCKAKKKSSGEKSNNKGFRYFSESFVHGLEVTALPDGCEVKGKCHRSKRKNEKPHEMNVSLATVGNSPCVVKSNCSCPIGLSEGCGHVVGMLYQLASFKMLGQKAIPEDVAKTSQPQTHHIPRGEKIRGKAVQDIEVRGYSQNRTDETLPRSVKSTIYNPVRGDPIIWSDKHQTMSDAGPDFLILEALRVTDTPMVASKFGTVPKGSILSYQQKLGEEYVMNICDGIGFPELPTSNKMENEVCVVLSAAQATKLEGLKLTMTEIKRFEEQTRLQSTSPLWYKIRAHRITASKVGDIFKRRKNEETLATRLHSTRHVTTAAMKQGLASEPIAARAYAEARDNKLNLYPCGVVCNFWAPWIAASPDRKVYYPDRVPPFGLLEIKCPQVASVLEVPYLIKDVTGQLKLKRNHNYYYQVLTQLAVTGLDWCDFCVWCSGDYHIETIYFNEDLWKEIKNKIDMFFFNYFL